MFVLTLLVLVFNTRTRPGIRLEASLDSRVGPRPGKKSDEMSWDEIDRAATFHCFVLKESGELRFICSDDKTGESVGVMLSESVLPRNQHWRQKTLDAAPLEPQHLNHPGVVQAEENNWEIWRNYQYWWNLERRQFCAVYNLLTRMISVRQTPPMLIQLFSLCSSDEN